MKDELTIGQMQRDIMKAVTDIGWGRQNPQHMAMAMTVEMSELLEHFQWLDPDGVKKLMACGEDTLKTRREIGFEFADVLIYGLQIADALGIDMAEMVEEKLSIIRGRWEKRA